MKNYELLCELAFYDDTNISRKYEAFIVYAEITEITYKVEIINNKSLSDLLHMSKNSIKNLLDELLREKRGFKFVLSTKIVLKQSY